MNKFIKDNLKLFIALIIGIFFIFNVGNITNIFFPCNERVAGPKPCNTGDGVIIFLTLLLTIILLLLSITYKLFKVIKKTYVKILLSVLVVSLLLGLIWAVGLLLFFL